MRKIPERFQYSWLSQFPTWLVYSPTKDAAYCLRCFLFASKSNAHFGANAYGGRISKLEKSQWWEKLWFSTPDHSSPHFTFSKLCEDLMNQLRSCTENQQNEYWIIIRGLKPQLIVFGGIHTNHVLFVVMTKGRHRRIRVILVRWWNSWRVIMIK